MSSEQFLLTIGVALLVFDSKKIPHLIANMAVVISTWRRWYHDMAVKFEQTLQQALYQKQLEQNEQKAQEAEKKGNCSPTIIDEE